MTNHDINEYFDQTVCYPRDLFAKTNLTQKLYVVNSDESSGPGKHWVALYNGKDCIYFDSFGVAPLPEVEKLMLGSKKPCYYNTYRIQDFDSNKCGYFCINFLENVSDFKSFNDWLLQFDVEDYKKNDDLIMENLKH